LKPDGPEPVVTPDVLGLYENPKKMNIEMNNNITPPNLEAIDPLLDICVLAASPTVDSKLSKYDRFIKHIFCSFR